MAMLVPNKATKKITVTLPEELIARLDAYVPSRQRSSFITQAIASQLAIAEQLEALEESAGAWSAVRYPEFATGDDIDNWLLDFRRGWAGNE